MVEQGSGARWCILRTSGQKTLKLADSLAVDGFEVWTPRRTVTIRVPRANVRREVPQAIMPSYIFASERHLLDLLKMTRMEVRPRQGAGWGQPAHARFSVMRYGERFPLIEDRYLQALRQIERKAEIQRIRVKKADPFPVGVSVRVKDDVHHAWGGMIGRVIQSKSKDSRVRFASGSMEITIRTSLLDLNDIGHASIPDRDGRSEAA